MSSLNVCIEWHSSPLFTFRSVSLSLLHCHTVPVLGTLTWHIETQSQLGVFPHYSHAHDVPVSLYKHDRTVCVDITPDWTLQHLHFIIPKWHAPLLSTKVMFHFLASWACVFRRVTLIVGVKSVVSQTYQPEYSIHISLLNPHRELSYTQSI